MNPVEDKIRAKLISQFQPSHLEVFNESHMHNVPPGSESHFKVVIATTDFVGKRQVQRHQAIYAALAEELSTEIHALALHTFSPEEWVATGAVPNSPQCLGGSKHS